MYFEDALKMVRNKYPYDDITYGYKYKDSWIFTVLDKNATINNMFPGGISVRADSNGIDWFDEKTYLFRGYCGDPEYSSLIEAFEHGFKIDSRKEIAVRPIGFPMVI